MSRDDKGWFGVPGIRPRGDRTLAEQMLGLDLALSETAGKTVLDLGCAEGMISREFAKAGAARVVGVELLASHVEIAKKVCREFKQIELICAHLEHHAKANPAPAQFDIVLALGIIHKLHDPNVALVFAARSARTLLCFRAPARARGGVVKSKFTSAECNVPNVMRAHGFADEGIHEGVRGEAVQYWRRR